VGAVHRQRPSRQPPSLTASRSRATAVALVATLAVGCGGAKPHARKAPDLQAFLRLPVATPSACGGSVSGATAGRRSPWVGTVDVSVFLRSSAPPADVAALRPRLTALPGVTKVYFESADEAYAEFQRLYTCSTDVSRSAVPASYRLVLAPMTRAKRDSLVTRIRAMSGVESVSCDPSSPCLQAS
jgi:hypothetical protein